MEKINGVATIKLSKSEIELMINSLYMSTTTKIPNSWMPTSQIPLLHWAPGTPSHWVSFKSDNVMTFTDSRVLSYSNWSIRGSRKESS